MGHKQNIQTYSYNTFNREEKEKIPDQTYVNQVTRLKNLISDNCWKDTVDLCANTIVLVCLEDSF
jgi:hypothetical protein